MNNWLGEVIEHISFKNGTIYCFIVYSKRFRCMYVLVTWVVAPKWASCDYIILSTKTCHKITAYFLSHYTLGWLSNSSDQTTHFDTLRSVISVYNIHSVSSNCVDSAPPNCAGCSTPPRWFCPINCVASAPPHCIGSAPHHYNSFVLPLWWFFPPIVMVLSSHCDHSVPRL